MVNGQLYLFRLLIEQTDIVVGFSMERMDGQGLLVTLDRLFSLPYFLIQGPQIAITFDIARIDGEGFLKRAHAFFITVGKIEESSQVIMRFLIARVDFQGFLINFLGPVEISKVLIEDSHIIISLGLGRI